MKDDDRIHRHAQEIDAHLARLDRLATRQAILLSVSLLMTESLMADRAEFNTELAATKKLIEDDNKNDQKVVDRMAMVIGTLEQKIIDLGVQGDFTAELAELNAIKAMVKPVTSSKDPGDGEPGETPIT